MWAIVVLVGVPILYGVFLVLKAAREGRLSRSKASLKLGRAVTSAGAVGRVTDPQADEGEAPAKSDEVDVSPVGMGIAFAGAAAMVIGVFLPAAESTKFLRVVDNSLIQQAWGWAFIGLGAAIAAAAYRAYRNRPKTSATILLGFIAIGLAIYLGTTDEVLKLGSEASSSDLQDLGLQDSLDALSRTEKASPGVGIYLVGVGGLLAMIGGFQILNSEPSTVEGDRESEPTKRCPDCSETVLAAAKVCRHCGYRFDTT